MTMLREGVTLKEVDLGLVERLGGAWVGTDLISSTILINGVGAPIFMEEPDLAVVMDRAFPSISVEFISMVPDRSRMTSYILSEYVNDDGNTRDLLHDPEPYNIEYRIHTWARNASDDRDLIQAMHEVLYINGEIEIDGKYWSYERDDMMVGDVLVDDQRVYHKGWHLRVIVVILPTLPIKLGIPIVQEVDQGWFNGIDAPRFDRRLINDGTTTVVLDTEE